MRAQPAGHIGDGLSRAGDDTNRLHQITGEWVPTDAGQQLLLVAASGARVEATVQLLEPLAIDVRVDLGRRDVSVAQHLLYRSEVRPMLEQMRREAVTDHVGAQARQGDAHLPPVSLQRLPEGL